MSTQKNHNLSFVLLVLLLACGDTAMAQSADLFNNTNGDGVTNGPRGNPQFTLSSTTRITQLVTYHWNFGRGARPGSISLRSVNGNVFGPFRATGTAGQGGAANVNWIANINVVIPAGEYSVFDSDPSTWSNNARSRFQGFAIVRGMRLVAKGPKDRGSDNPDTPTPLIPASSMPTIAPRWAGQTVSDQIGGSDTVDYYLLTVTGPNGSSSPRVLIFQLSGFNGNVQLQLLAYEQIRSPNGNPIPARQLIANGTPVSGNPKAIALEAFPGSYLIRIAATGAPTTYRLVISTPTN